MLWILEIVAMHELAAHMQGLCTRLSTLSHLRAWSLEMMHFELEGDVGALANTLLPTIKAGIKFRFWVV